MAVEFSLLQLGGAVSLGLVTLFVYNIIKASQSHLHALPGPESESWIAGNFPNLIKESPLEQDFGEHLSDTYGLVAKTHSLLGAPPDLCVSDPEVVNRILSTEPDSWSKPAMGNTLLTMMFGPGLLSAPDESHKRQRKMLNPLFTSAQMRVLKGTFYDIGQKLSSKISSLIENKDEGDVVDVLRLASATALEAVGSAGLGYEFDALNVEGEYKLAAKQLISTLAEVGPTIPFLKLLSSLGPYSFRAWWMDTFCPWMGSFGRSVVKFRSILDVMERTSVDVYQRKLAAMDGDGQTAPKTDILSNLVRACRADASSALTEEEALAQINTMIFAGHETTANTISLLLQQLAQDPVLQSRLREEIETNRAADDLDYDSLMALPLLDATCREILRVYPPLPRLERQAKVDTFVPLSQPIKTADGKGEVRELLVPKGTTVRLSCTGINRSTAIWGPDAKEFRAERWLAPLPDAAAKIPGAFSSILTFSGGPRACIGWRFAVLEIKVVLAVLLQQFVFEPSGRPGEKVQWISGAVLYPVIQGDEKARPQLPLKVIPRS